MQRRSQQQEIPYEDRWNLSHEQINFDNERKEQLENLYQRERAIREEAVKELQDRRSRLRELTRQELQEEVQRARNEAKAQSSQSTQIDASSTKRMRDEGVSKCSITFKGSTNTMSDS